MIAEIEALTGHYEALRAWASGAADVTAPPPGLALVYRRGLPGWIACRQMWLPKQARDATAPGGRHPQLEDSDPELTRILATMVEACRQGVDT